MSAAWATPLVIGAGAVALRLSLMIFLLPGLGERAVPVRIRLAVLLALLFALLPVVLTQSPAPTATDLVPLFAAEALIGFGLGFTCRVMIFALTAAGTIIAQSISLSQILGSGLMDEGNPSVSLLLTIGGAALFVTLDLHTAMIGLFAESYDVFPLMTSPDTATMAEWAVMRTADAFALAVSLALPFVLMGFLYTLVLGLVAQAMPQMMVTFVGVPANVLAGLILLALSIGLLLTRWADALSAAPLRFW